MQGSFNKKNMTDIASTYETLKNTYGKDAIYPFLEWVTHKQDELRYVVKENIIFIKLELDLAHLLSEREIIAFRIRHAGNAVEQSPHYQRKNEEIDALIQSFKSMSERMIP